jgi:hypothetical protein
MSDPRPHGVHLVGSIPLGDAETVFQTTADILGSRLRRITDGETGGRLNWIIWQLELLMAHPQFDVVAPDPERYAPNPSVKRKQGLAASDLTFNELGYAREARNSWELFRKLQAEGSLPPHWRFQVSLPTPLAPVFAFIHEGERLETEPVYEAAMRREVGEIASFVPHDKLAIQWDTAVEFGILEGLFPAYFAEPERGVLERLVRYGGWVDEDIELGYHLCYGDADHKHLTEPTDAGKLVNVANRLDHELSRTIEWIHLPVPRDRSDAAYFAPLTELDLSDQTDLFLGLVHLTDGIEGTRHRIAAAQRAVARFGVATECGLGRRPPETIPQLLELQAEVSAPVV